MDTKLPPAPPDLPPAPPEPPPAPHPAPAEPPPAPPPLVTGRRRRQPWLSLLIVGLATLLLGGAGFLLANMANSDNDETFAAEVESLAGADPAAGAAELRPLVEDVDQAVRSFWEAARATARIQRQITATFDRALDRDQASGGELLKGRGERLIRRFARAAKQEAEARRDLSRALADLKEALS